MEMIDSLEFAEWRALYQIKPWGDDWAQTDLIAWMLHTVNSTKKLPVGHFLPTAFPAGVVHREPVWPSADVLAARFRQYEKSMGLTDGNVNR